MQGVGEVLAGAKRMEDFSASELQGMVSQFSATDSAATANCAALASCLAGLGPSAPTVLVANGATHALVEGIRSAAAAMPTDTDGIRHRVAILSAILSTSPNEPGAVGSAHEDVLDTLSADDELLLLLADIVASDPGTVAPEVALQAAHVLALAASQPKQVQRLALLSEAPGHLSRLRSPAASRRLAQWVEQVMTSSRGSTSTERSRQLSSSAVLLHLASADRSDEKGESDPAASAARQVLITDDAFARVVDALMDSPSDQTALHVEAIRHLTRAVVDARIRHSVEGTPSASSVRAGDVHKAMLALSRLLPAEEPEAMPWTPGEVASYVTWKDRSPPARVATARRLLAAFRNCCFALAITSPLDSPMPVAWETHKEHLPATVRVLSHPLTPHVFGAQILLPPKGEAGDEVGKAGDEVGKAGSLIPLPAGHWAAVALLRPVSRSAEDFAKLAAVPGAAAAMGNLLQIQAEYVSLAAHALRASGASESGQFGELMSQVDRIGGLLLGGGASIDGVKPMPLSEDEFSSAMGGMLLPDLGNMLASAAQANPALAAELWVKRGGHRSIPALTLATLSLEKLFGGEGAGKPPPYLGYMHGTQVMLQSSDLSAWEPAETSVLDSTLEVLRAVSVSPPRTKRFAEVVVGDVLGCLQAIAQHSPRGAVAVIPSIAPAAVLLERETESLTPGDHAVPVYLVRWMAAVLNVLNEDTDKSAVAATALHIASTGAAGAAIKVLSCVTTPGAKFEDEAEQPLRLLAFVWSALVEAGETSPEAALAAVRWSRQALHPKLLLSEAGAAGAASASDDDEAAAAAHTESAGLAAAAALSQGILGLFRKYDVLNGDQDGSALLVYVLFWLQEAGIYEPALIKDLLNQPDLVARIATLPGPTNENALAELVLVATRLLSTSSDHPAVGASVSEFADTTNLLAPILSLVMHTVEEDPGQKMKLMFMRALAPLTGPLLVAVHKHGEADSPGKKLLLSSADRIITLCGTSEHNSLSKLLQSAKLDDGSFDGDKLAVLQSLLELLALFAKDDPGLAMSMLGAGVGDAAEKAALELRAEASRTLRPPRLFVMSQSLQRFAPTGGSKNLLAIDIEAIAQAADELAAIVDDA